MQRIPSPVDGARGAAAAVAATDSMRTNAQPARAPRLAKWYALSALLLLSGSLFGLGIGWYGETGPIAQLDGSVRAWMRELRTPHLTGMALDFTALGSSTIVTLLTILFSIVFALLRDWRAIAHLAIASAGAGIWSRALKHLFERARPSDFAPLAEATGFSYPSGHALLSTALYLTFAVLACRLFRRVHERVVVFAIAGSIILLIGATRIYLGVHYPSDVIGGTAVGAGWACLLAGLIGYPRASDEPAHSG